MIDDLTTRRMRKCVSPSSSLRRHFFALARQVDSWVQKERPELAKGCSIGVTSLTRGAGKSTISFNLSCSMATLIRQDILLVESDFGKHYISRRLGHSRAIGLSELILGVAEPNEAVFPTPITNVDCMGCGRNSDQEALELPFGELPALIEEKFSNYRYRIFDLPLANHLTACHAIVPYLDGVVLAVESNHIDKGLIDRFRKQVENAGTDVIGIVLNKA